MQILQLLRDNASREKRPVNLVRNGIEASLYIYDIVAADWGVNAIAVTAALEQAAGAELLNVYFNTPGGDVFEGRTIIAALGRFAGKKVAYIDGLCASVGTSIALACDEIEMASGAFFMIHNAQGLVYGDKSALRDRANLLEKVEVSIISEYATKTGKEPDQIVTWMEAETWFTAAEALSNGFVDRLSAEAKPKNTWNLAAFGNAPAALKLEPEPTPPAKTSMTAANTNRLRLATIA